MRILKLESSASSPVATSLEVSMPHQPATFSLSKRQFSKSKSIMLSFQAGWFCSWSCINRYIHYHEVADSNGTFCFVRIRATEKMPSENADTAFVSNCNNDYN